MVPVPPHRVGNCYPLHELRQRLGVDRTHDEGPVIGHCAVREQARGVVVEPFAQRLQECSIVAWALEQRRFANAVVDDMKIVGAAGRAWTSGHQGASGVSNRGARTAACEDLSPRP